MKRRHLFLLAAGCWLLASFPLVRADLPADQRAQVEAAVDSGLRYLSAQQAADGSWDIQHQGKSPAVTSLALMAFMSRGHIPGRGEYGQAINRGIDYILDISERNNGALSANEHAAMYDHGISTVMLTEAYAMVDKTRRPRLERAVARSVRIILDAQAINKPPEYQGGWRYAPNSRDSDISVTGWQLMALRGAANVGANIPPRALEAGIAYIRARATPGGGFAYVGRDGPSPARTGTGVLALTLLGKHDAPEALAGGQYLLRNPVTIGTMHYYYSVYYCSQAANQLGGPVDESVNATVRKTLLSAQSHSNGAWGARGDDGVGATYATAMAVLALTVPYHYLPLYQR